MAWNNCEHFASYAFSGESSSEQVQQTAFMGGGTTASTVGGALTGAAMVPAATVLGFETLGTAAVYLGLMTQPAIWPWLVGGTVLGGSLGFGVSKLATPYVTKNEQENLYRALTKKSLLSMDDIDKLNQDLKKTLIDAVTTYSAEDYQKAYKAVEQCW
eukprot:CAMPEP_0114661466 /NCGR_PEP_ID=MMETSP0191-20121206/22541_1 /TAXON_ID=126664 /ORGANISM="Sorites sp." /LENGTH=157 /DNA_ID=CAMNT_0001894047 /DNA_START=319 /DNA_END=789 /DNA_ORIENTATION=+